MDHQKKTIKTEIRSFVESWNRDFSLDVWYRSYYKVRFNSLEHRQMNFLDMRFEFEENLLAVRIRDSQKRRKKINQAYLETGRWLFENKPSAVDIDAAFDNLDLKKLRKHGTANSES